MSECRDLSASERALKARFAILVKRCGGYVAAAEGCRVGSTQLNNYASMFHDQFAPLDVVADLEEIAGEPLVTAELAFRAGHILVPVDAPGEGQLAGTMARLGQEVGESFAAYGAAMADSRLSKREAERLARELAEVAAAAKAAIAVLTRKMGAGA